jgi:hypothetical protein
MMTKDFHISTGKELIAIKDRVRNLIHHWGEDGRYKEAVLKSVIERFLPSKYIIANGFVIKQTSDKNVHESSTQIDLLIYDSNYPVLFKEGDFVIVTPDSVAAIIEVKSKIRVQDLNKIIQKANDNGRFIYNGKFNKENFFFNGIFSFEGFANVKSVDKIMHNIIDANNLLKEEECFKKYKVNHISFNKDLFLQYKASERPNNCTSFIFRSPDLSFSYFISCLMDYLSGDSIGNNSNLWFVNEDGIEFKGAFV